MPIIFNNGVTKAEEPKPAAPPQQKSLSDQINVQQLPTTSSPDHHVLVVDGKTKLVSKRSQYLIDMMTTEEE
jgi:hypothetical protein